MLGVIQKRRGRFGEAMDTFRKGIAREPANHSPWYNLGNTHLTIGEVSLDAIG
jgi:Flp pilus assembly protein TadD